MPKGHLAFAALNQFKTSLRVHESGISHRNLVRRTDVEYAQMDSLSFSQTRRYVNGIYVENRCFFQFNFGARALVFNATIKQDVDPEIEFLRDRVARSIAEKLSKQLEDDGTAPWTRSLRFVQSGIEYFDGAEWHLVPFDRFGKCEIDNGYFYLRERSSEFPVMHEDTIAPNFFAGFALLNERLSGLQSIDLSR